MRTHYNLPFFREIASDGTSFATRGQTVFKKIGHKPDGNEHKSDKHQSNCSVSQTVKVSKGVKIKNRYNQVQHLTQDTDGKVTNS